MLFLKRVHFLSLRNTTLFAGYGPDVTTYDYNAPLSESGDYTDKYRKIQQLLRNYNKIKTKEPTLPEPIKKVVYPPITITEQKPLGNLLEVCESIQSEKLLSMESLPINNNNGQSYGYIVYRKTNIKIPKNSVLKIEGRVCDTIMVLINGELKSNVLKEPNDLNEFGYWKLKDSDLNLGDGEYENATLDLVVENWGRVNYGKLYQFNQKKGLWQGNVLLNEEILQSWQIFPLEFKKTWTQQLSGWQESIFQQGPVLYRTILNTEEPADTYIDMRNWNKGFVVVNNFVLGRYCHLGPQQSIYLPAPLLKQGENEIMVFEHFIPAKQLNFTDNLIFEEHL